MRYPILTATLLSVSTAASAHPDTNATAHADLGLIGGLLHMLGEHYVPLLFGALVVALIGWLRHPARGRSDRLRRGQ
ncbi:MAG TPA: hypothetical protein VIR60_05560 [Gammaproteobacteria bacterium]